MIDPSTTASWSALNELSATIGPIRTLLDHDRAYLRREAAGIHADFSRQRLDKTVLNELLNLARDTGVESHRDAMFRGDHINTTENRAVLHTALRAPAGSSLVVDGTDVVVQVHEVLDQMARCVDSIRSGKWKGATGKPIDHVVNIGIGGSDLGPAMAYIALGAYVAPHISCSFVSNVDPTDLKRVLERSDPETTLFIVASKTFTTTETMTNAHIARAWILERLGDCPVDQVVPRHFIALSTNAAAVKEFGIHDSNMFGFWDWVGGRYSMDSAIGLSTMIAIGPINFSEMLAGFHEMDVHFQNAPLENNVPVLMGVAAIWNRNFLGIETTAVLPYSEYLSRFPAYLQQLTMESNGKRVRSDGEPVNYSTGAIYWGEPGTNGQHSFYQLLHQGTSMIDADIIVVAKESQPATNSQPVLVANALAQASVLSVGVTAEELVLQGTDPDLVAHKVMPGDRPVSMIMMQDLTPRTLGALIALYEHSVFVQGAIWGINSFDQWGVELGKKVATGILGSFENSESVSQFDSATAQSIKEYLALRD